jgi:hypothetical protein
MDGMRQNKRRRLAGALGAAAGWVALWLVCRDVLPAQAQGVVLYTLLLAEVASTTILAGTAGGTSSGWLPGERGAGQLVTGWTIFLALLVLLAGTGRLTIYAEHLTGVAMLALLAGLLCAAKTGARNHSGHGACGMLVALRGLIFAALLAGGARLVVPSWQGALGLICLAALLLVLAVRQTAGPSLQTGRSRRTARQIDVLLAGLLLSPRMALAYLLARAMARVVTLILDHLMEAAGFPLDGTSADTRMARFAADAARLNLGLLLIGGAAALGVLSLAGPAMSFWPDLAIASGAVLHWLLLAAAAPAIFGAAPVLMRAGGMKREHGLVTATNAAAAVTAAWVLDLRTAADLACLVAVAELGTAATCAVILGLRAGVWPGLTALLIRGIRLF